MKLKKVTASLLALGIVGGVPYAIPNITEHGRTSSQSQAFVLNAKADNSEVGNGGPSIGSPALETDTNNDSGEAWIGDAVSQFDTEVDTNHTAYTYENLKYTIWTEEELRDSVANGSTIDLSYYESVFERTDKFIVINGCEETAESLDIPSEIDGVPVLCIANLAFDGKHNLKSVTLSDSIIQIGYRAFGNCSALGSIDLPASLRQIDASAFESCTSLSDITLQSPNVTIDTGAFYGTAWLENALLNSPYAILDGVLIECANTADTILIPDSVINIADGAFSKCKNLANVIIPSSIEKISTTAFSNCVNLNTVYILNENCEIYKAPINGSDISLKGGIFGRPNSSAQAYAEKTGLKFIPITTDIDEGVTADTEELSDGDMLYIGISNNFAYMTVTGQYASSEFSTKNERYADYDKVAFLITYDGISDELTIPSEIDGLPVVVGMNSFENNSSIRKLVISEGVTDLMYKSFYGCKKIESIELPESLSNIDDQALMLSSRIKDLTILNTACNVDNISGLEHSCDKYTTIYGYANSTAQALAEKRGAKFIAIDTEVPGTYNNIEYAVVNESVFVPITDSMSEEEQDKLDKLHSLSNLYHLNRNQEFIAITGYAGADRDIEIPSEIDGLPVLAISDDAFKDNTHIKSILMPDGIKYIGSQAFKGCSNLEELSIPEGVETLKFSTFDRCSNLKSVELPKSLTEIHQYAFEECKSLEKIELPEGVQKIYSNAICNCSNLKEVVFLNRDCTMPNNMIENIDGTVYTGIISGFKDSTAEKFANTNGYEFNMLDIGAPIMADLGDSNCDGTVNISDAVLIMQSISNPSEYKMSEQGIINADVVGNDGVTASDALVIQCVEAKIIETNALPIPSLVELNDILENSGN